jgi:hypothetical protein
MMTRLALRTLFAKHPGRAERRPIDRAAPSGRLLAAALSGILSASAGCAGPDDPAGVPSANEPAAASNLASADDAGAAEAGAAVYNFTVSETGEIPFADFKTACDQRGGLIQTSATCAGINACRGFSTNGTHLVEHSCKGLSGCGPGMSCVVLPADGKKTGKEIYEEQLPISGEWGCGSTCHGQFNPTYDLNHFTLYVRPGTVTPDEALARFKTGSRDRLSSIIAFGVQGLNENGAAYSTMSGYHSYYSVAEIGRLIDYVRTLPVEVKVYGNPAAPASDAGAPDAAPPSGDGGAPDAAEGGSSDGGAG